MDDNEKLILAAQAQFFEQLTKVRLELSQDAKDMRSDILEALKSAHGENIKRMEDLGDALKAHESKDDTRFLTVFRWMWICVGGAAVFGIIGNIALALWK